MLISLTRADAGRTVMVHLADVVQISLKFIGTAGYIWDWTCIPDRTFSVVDDTVVPPGQGGTGGEATKTLVLSPVRTGSARIELKLWRPFQGGSSIIDNITYAFDVAA